jgi:hypothetical protein
MAGVTLPSVALLIGLTVFVIARYGYRIEIPVERAIIFPMAVVPNAWGAWNIIYLALHPRRWPIGLHGALLPLLLVPAGLWLARGIGISFVTPARAATFLPVGLAFYYLAWKYLVRFFNEILEIA